MILDHWLLSISRSGGLIEVSLAPIISIYPKIEPFLGLGYLWTVFGQPRLAMHDSSMLNHNDRLSAHLIQHVSSWPKIGLPSCSYVNFVELEEVPLH